MSRILVVYGTTEGHTRKIAEYIGEQLQQRGHIAQVIDSASADARQVQVSHDGVILGGSVHEGKHQAALSHFVKERVERLQGLPTAFFSVSLSAASQVEAERLEAERLAKAFDEEAGLGARIVRCFSGALLFTKYNWFKRTLMQWIARREAGDIDGSQDHEYTDWNDVGAFVDEFLTTLAAVPARPAP